MSTNGTAQRMRRLVVAALCAGWAVLATAQEYPTRPVTFVVALQPGTSSDTVARLLAPAMSAALGQTVLIENKPGANSLIGYENVARQAPADGYTFALVIIGDLALLPVTVPSSRLDVTRDLPPFIGLAEARYVLVTAATKPWRTLSDMLAEAKANPGKLNFSASTISTRLPLASVARDAGVDVVMVPFPAGPFFQQAVIAGTVDLGIFSEGTALSLGEKVRPLAVTGSTRSASLPNVPTLAELGFPNVQGLALTLNVRAGTPKAVRDKLYDAARAALDRPEVKAGLARARFEILSDPSPEVALKRLTQEAAFFADVAAKTGFKPD
jgi:tripartite-type tricarboxylate transporter receptor subunit TctC